MLVKLRLVRHQVDAMVTAVDLLSVKSEDDGWYMESSVSARETVLQHTTLSLLGCLATWAGLATRFQDQVSYDDNYYYQVSKLCYQD